MINCNKLTIFEGPDGSGKTTAARSYAEQVGARYVHFGPLPRVGDGLGRIYVEAMLPALLGYQHVVFDRSWLSEIPYGTAFREGYDRLGDGSRRMLERLALRCGAVVVSCDPGWAKIKASFMARKHMEMLENDHQLYQVHKLYQEHRGQLPSVTWDYGAGSTLERLSISVSERRPAPHPLHLSTAGAWDAPIAIVGESFGEVKNQDAMYQWPFASFSRAGCSQWLAAQLDLAEVPERRLLWVNADAELDFLSSMPQLRHLVALGVSASERLRRLPWPVGTTIHQVPHPQFFKRFGSFKGSSRYPLVPLLKELNQ